MPNPRPDYQTENASFVARGTEDGYLPPIDPLLRKGSEDDPPSPVPPGGWQNEPPARGTADGYQPPLDPATAKGGESVTVGAPAHTGPSWFDDGAATDGENTSDDPEIEIPAPEVPDAS